MENDKIPNKFVQEETNRSGSQNRMGIVCRKRKRENRIGNDVGCQKIFRFKETKET